MESAKQQVPAFEDSPATTTTMIRTLVNKIHLHPYQLFVYLAGGASQVALSRTTRTHHPYSVVSKLWGEMAQLAYNRALKLNRTDSPVVGVGFTCSLTGIHPKHGEHRFHIATRTSNRSWLSVVTLSKGLRTREDEDEVSSQFLLMAIANA